MKQIEQVIYSSIQTMQKQLSYEKQAKQIIQRKSLIKQKTKIISLSNQKLENFQQKIETSVSQSFSIDNQLKDKMQKSTIQLLQSQHVDDQINNCLDYQLLQIQIPDLSWMKTYLNHFNQHEIFEILFVEEKINEQRQNLSMVKNRFLEKIRKMNEQLQKVYREKKKNRFLRYQ